MKDHEIFGIGKSWGKENRLNFGTDPDGSWIQNQFYQFSKLRKKASLDIFRPVRILNPGLICSIFIARQHPAADARY